MVHGMSLKMLLILWWHQSVRQHAVDLFSMMDGTHEITCHTCDKRWIL